MLLYIGLGYFHMKTKHIKVFEFSLPEVTILSDQNYILDKNTHYLNNIK